MYKKSNLFVYVFVVIRQFSKQLRHGVAKKTESWHVLSHKQYFFKHRFFHICRCVFNVNLIKVLYIFPDILCISQVKS